MDRTQAERIWSVLGSIAESGVPPSQGLESFDVGSSEYVELFERELLDELVSKGAATCRFLVGPYGAGKTHLLGLMRERALAKGMVVLSAELVSGLNLDAWDALTRFVLERMQLRVDNATVTGLPAILAVIGSRKIDLGRVEAMPAPHTSFRRAMILGLSPLQVPEPARLWLQRYLEGQRVTATRLRQSGVNSVKDPLTARNAEHVLNTVLMTLFAMGVPGTLLTFDESETALQITGNGVSPRRRRAANLMRRLIDACPTGRLFGALVVFAVLPDFIQRSADAYPALGQRIYTPMTEFALPWRSPVIRVEDANSVDGPVEFLSGLATRMSDLAARAIGVSQEALRNELLREGNLVLAANAGSGYRRPLLKRLAAVTLSRMEESPEV